MQHRLLSLSAALLAAQLARAQAAPRIISGQVTARGIPVAEVNVFLRQSLAGVLTDSAGRFRIVSQDTGRVTLIAQRIGFVPREISVAAADTGPVRIVLESSGVILAPLTAVASRFAAGEERGATLTTLDVVSTAGTTADVARAIQTLPGIQALDEGTGLFVRGGDYNETTLLLNDATLRTSFSFESPNGTFIGTVDPFLLDGIVFSAGGFGARYGNALSGIAALRTQGMPAKTAYSVGAGLAALSASAAAVVSPTLGLHLAANQTDTRALFQVNGSTQPYDPAPRGFDRSGSLIWNYRPAGEVKVFAIAQQTTLGTGIDEASYAGVFHLDIDGTLVVANWSDSLGKVRPYGRLSHTTSKRLEDYGAYRLTTAEEFLGGGAGAELVLSSLLTLRGGVEREDIQPTIEGAIPETSYDRKPGAPSVVFSSTPSGRRTALYGEADFVALRRARVVAGLRRDVSSLTSQATVDPRFSTAITIVPGVVVSGAWGIYHQIPDPLTLDATLGDPTLPSMRATHSIVGLQLGSDGLLLRVEGYEKRYQDLAQLTRDYDVVGGGEGVVRGVDLFAAGSALPGMRWRASVSAMSSDRTDPHTGAMARAPFDVPLTSTLVLQQMLPRGLHLALTHRFATGKPYTVVTSATYDPANAVWVPAYGPPMAERLPDLNRFDAGVTWLRRVGQAQGVFYFSVNNLFDRENLFAIRYSPDYQTRIPVRSLFNRSIYFGASFTR